MMTIYLNGSTYKNSNDVHQALKMLLDLPDYYGMNADALHDLLSERREPVSLFLAGTGSGEVADTLRKIKAVIADLGGTVKEY